MGWIYLIAAGIMEWGWPLGLKYAWDGQNVRVWPAIGGVFFMLVSGALLFMAQRTIPMGTAYAVWTGIGAVGAFVIGVLVFKEAASAIRVTGALLIVSGIVAMKLGHASPPG